MEFGVFSKIYGGKTKINVGVSKINVEFRKISVMSLNCFYHFGSKQWLMLRALPWGGTTSSVTLQLDITEYAI